MAEETCPPATQDIAINLENRKKAIDTAMYGPLNPAEPNEEYWTALGAEWNVDAETAKQQRCGNCAVFIQTPEMKACIEGGLTDNADEFESIDAAGELGYCEIFDFKCASARTCRAWVAGGPVTAAGKKTVAQTPAPKKDQIKGSDKNSKGSASGSKKINFDAKTETTLKNKVAEHNETAPKGRKASLSMLKAVYRRGAGAFSVSHRPGMTRNQWAMGRVNAFLRLLKSGKPSSAAYTTDNDLLPPSHPKSSKKKKSVTASFAGVSNPVVEEERVLADSLVQIADMYGKFDEDGDGIWAGYVSAEENEDAGIGVKCANCVLYQGGAECAIVALEVEPEGSCRFAIIPDGVVKSEKDYEMLIASACAEGELIISLKEESEYNSPEEIIFAMTEFSGLGYDAEQAFRASWLRAVRNNDDPFKRVSLLASMTYDSLDADLLPTREVVQ